MQSLFAKHGKTIVSGGPLNGTAYEAVGEERLRKAAKRYTGDSSFQKYAKAYVTIVDMNLETVPDACVTVHKTESLQSPSWHHSVVSWFLGMGRRLRFSWLCNTRLGISLLIIFALTFVLRPSVSTLIARMMVTFLRLISRRIVTLLSMILDGFMDEIIYQVDFTVREALPEGFSGPETIRASYNLISHVISGTLGVCVTLLYQMRRTPLPA